MATPAERKRRERARAAAGGAKRAEKDPTRRKRTVGRIQTWLDRFEEEHPNGPQTRNDAHVLTALLDAAQRTGELVSVHDQRARLATLFSGWRSGLEELPTVFAARAKDVTPEQITVLRRLLADHVAGCAPE